MEPQSRSITTHQGSLVLTVNTFEDGPSIQITVRWSDGQVGAYLTEDEARALAANLTAAADDYDEENSRRGEQYDEMRLEA